MSSRPILPGLVLGLALLLALPAQALAQWVWRDAGGRVTASDRPPPREIPEKDIISRPNQARAEATAATATAAAAAASAPADGSTAAATATAAAPPAAPTALDREVEARRRAAEQERAAKARAEEARVAEQRADNCRRARSHLVALESGQRIARTNDKGEREVLDDKGRADEMRRAREVLASDCR